MVCHMVSSSGQKIWPTKVKKGEILEKYSYMPIYVTISLSRGKYFPLFRDGRERNSLQLR